MKKYTVTNSWVACMECSYHQEVEAESMEEALEKAIEIGDWQDFNTEESGAIHIPEHQRNETYLVESDDGESKYFDD